MGTANADIAVQAANMVIHDVSGIDINAGCPKHFSIHAGMGAALLKTPDLLCSILTNLVEQVGKPNSKPISVKIRLMPQQEDSLELVNKLVKTGIANLTLHCRTQPMRNREAPIRYYIDKIKQICDNAGVSFIINGAILNREDFRKLQEQFGEDCGGMIAEKAEQNPSVFSMKPLHWIPLIKEYTEIAESMGNFFGNTKYMLTRMVPGKDPWYQVVIRAKTYEQLHEMMDPLVAPKKETEKTVEEKKGQEKKTEKTEAGSKEVKKHKLDTSESSCKKQQVAPV
jgi:tRNA-dihydrouridine synthase 2